MEITMTHELENLANKTFRDEEFIQFQKEELFLDLEDLSDFRPIGEVLKQMSFNFYFLNQPKAIKENFHG